MPLFDDSLPYISVEDILVLQKLHFTRKVSVGTLVSPGKEQSLESWIKWNNYGEEIVVFFGLCGFKIKLSQRRVSYPLKRHNNK